MLQFEFTYRLMLRDERPDGTKWSQVIADFDKPCLAIISEGYDGDWYPETLMVDGFVIPESHRFHDELLDCLMWHRPRIDQLWAERERQAVLEPEGA